MDSRWGWMAMLDRLTNGDITKMDDVCDRNYIECLNFLSFWSERDRYMESLKK